MDCFDSLFPILRLNDIISGLFECHSYYFSDIRLIVHDENQAVVLARAEETYREQAETIEHVDGLSMVLGDWRFNLRMSNTEPVVRLNVESRGDPALMQAKTKELLALIDAT